MPLDGNVALFVAPDLAKPSYEALAWVLEHPETWPAKWHWNFAFVAFTRSYDCGTAGCAAGIADALWGEAAGKVMGFAIDEHSRMRMCARPGHPGAHRIFIEGQMDSHLVTPAVVAKRIRQYLAGKPITFTGHDFE